MQWRTFRVRRIIRMNSKNMSLKQLLKTAVDARPSSISVGTVKRVNPPTIPS